MRLINPAHERPLSTIRIEGQLVDLRVEGHETLSVRRRSRPVEHICRPTQQLMLLCRDLRGMSTELFSRLSERLATFDDSHRRLCLDGCPVIASRSIHRLAPAVRHLTVASVKPGYHLSYRPNSWRSAPSIPH